MRITARSSDYYLAADECGVVLSVQLSLVSLAYSSAFIVLLKIACFILLALNGYQYWHLTVNRRSMSITADYRSVYTNSR